MFTTYFTQTDKLIVKLPFISSFQTASKELSCLDAEFILKQIKTGMPHGIKLHRVFHELLLVESILFWLKTHDFIFLKTESRLKSEYYTEHYKQQRAERKTYIFPLKKGFDAPPGKSFGDYEIYLVKKEDQQFWSWECEIAHKMTLHQIRKKTSPHVWFCNNQKISDLIKIGLNKNAVILSDIHQPSMISKMLRDNFYAKNISSEAQKNLLEKIELLGGIISCKLLASLGLKKDTYYRAKLEDLYQQGHLFKASSCLVPGVSRGNNENYYSLETIDICSNFNELTKGVIRSHLVQAVLSQGFKYNNYHSDFDAFSFTKDKINYLFLVDYTFETVEQNIVRLNKALKHISWARIGIACNDYNRAKSFFEGKKNILVWTLYKLKQAKSYRYRNEAK